jgi:hypothetical protein
VELLNGRQELLNGNKCPPPGEAVLIQLNYNQEGFTLGNFVAKTGNSVADT